MVWLGPHRAARAPKSIGLFGLAYDLELAGATPITVNIGTTAVSGSVLVVAHFGRFSSLGVPTDTFSNNLDNGTPDYLRQSGYAGGLWPGFGMSIFTKTAMTGGAGHTVSVAKSGAANEEATLIAVEVTGTTTIEDSSILAIAASGAGATLTSTSVTTAGPAFLVGFWSGDGVISTNPMDVDSGHVDWQVLAQVALEEAQAPNGHVQSALLGRYVGAAGTYTLQVKPRADQGAILGLVAVR